MERTQAVFPRENTSWMVSIGVKMDSFQDGLQNRGMRNGTNPGRVPPGKYQLDGFKMDNFQDGLRNRGMRNGMNPRDWPPGWSAKSGNEKWNEPRLCSPGKTPVGWLYIYVSLASTTWVRVKMKPPGTAGFLGFVSIYRSDNPNCGVTLPLLNPPEKPPVKPASAGCARRLSRHASPTWPPSTSKAP